VDAAIPFWFMTAMALAVTCAVALFVRFRQAALVEKQQIKWLLYACGLFTATLVPQFFVQSGLLYEVLALGWYVSILAVPAAIAVAILRYRLFDIDLIIRRTLLYAVLTAVLALVYFVAVTLSQTLFENAAGERSPISIVLSTLVIAALFGTLRRRLQSILDRRFFRSKYDAAQALAKFARFARDEVELDALSRELLQVMNDTVHPSQTGLWLKPVATDAFSSQSRAGGERYRTSVTYVEPTKER
jgi:hypothetical protein